MNLQGGMNGVGPESSITKKGGNAACASLQSMRYKAHFMLSPVFFILFLPFYCLFKNKKLCSEQERRKRSDPAAVINPTLASFSQTKEIREVSVDSKGQILTRDWKQKEAVQ